MEVSYAEELQAPALDGLAVESVAFYLAELRRLELAQVSRGNNVRYVTARVGSRVVGVLPWYRSSSPLDAAMFSLTLPLEDGLCLAGSPGGAGNQLAVGAALGRSDAAAVARGLVEFLRANADGCRYVVLPELTSSQVTQLGIREPVAESTRWKAVQRVLWSSFDDYVMWLPRQRRSSVRRERRRFLDGAIAVREQSLIDVSEELAPLLAQTEQRYGRDVVSEQMEFYLLSIAMHHDDCCTLVAYRDGSPVAFALILARGTTWDVRAWGCDYDALGDEDVYFNMLHYEPLIRAIDRGVDALDFGTGSLQSKVHRGCELAELRTVLIHAK